MFYHLKSYFLIFCSRFYFKCNSLFSNLFCASCFYQNLLRYQDKILFQSHLYYGFIFAYILMLIKTEIKRIYNQIHFLPLKKYLNDQIMKKCFICIRYTSIHVILVTQWYVCQFNVDNNHVLVLILYMWLCVLLLPPSFFTIRNFLQQLFLKIILIVR